MQHVFAVPPRFSVACKPGIILVRCSGCGKPHEEYFGPDDRDELRAELELLRREFDAAVRIHLERQREL